ncbi:SH3 domain-containing protein [Aurantimonas sp. VKM B-3413]|uniref:SH3 domain-containing protein n=1 Tax=Aurantimonas sp. VKM B-3413 TaxID=2779401 RepID=UPI001E56BD41|nr:SH3 domain-containing protein [Aurantimonas sp. VKM B-3413]MCB8835990.1 SH3 domain-containing protein [Aurantimonas sp. VKM B-3413]
MTTGDSSRRQTTSGDRGLSNDDLRRRLIDRQDAHLRSQAEAGLTGRLTRWQEERKRPVTRLFVPRGGRPGGFAALRQRPVLAYLAAIILSGVIVAGLAMLLAGRDGHSLSAGPGASADSVLTAAGGLDRPVATASSAGEGVAPEAPPLPAKAQQPKPAGFAGEQRATDAGPVKPSSGEVGGRLRRTATDLPATSASEAPIDPVAAALALRLPVDLTATGSVPGGASPSATRTGLPIPVEGGGVITIPPSVLPAVGQVAERPAEPEAPAVDGLQPALPTAALGAGLSAADEESEAPEVAATTPAAPAASPGDETELAASTGGSQNGRINTAVNLRESPEVASKVLAILPKGGTVGILSCNDWCEVEASGKRGFVFNKYVDRAEGG